MSEELKKSIKESVEAAINSGKVVMKPRWHFIVQAVLLIVGIVVAVLALLYLTSLIIFSLHQTGLWFAPGFGLQGINELLFDLPWFLLLAGVAFIALLEYLVKKYSFAYRKPLLYSAVGIIALVVAGGFIVSLTPIHSGLLTRELEEHMPFVGALYQQYGAPKANGRVIPGQIIEVRQNGYTINTPRREILTVLVNDDTQLPEDITLRAGDIIVVIGDRDKDYIRALGIKKINNSMVLPSPRRQTIHEEIIMPVPQR